jgi:acyl carrier protein
MRSGGGREDCARVIGEMTMREQVFEFVAAKTLRDPDSISEDSNFYDLGIDGDDATELLEAFAEHFEVDMNGFVARLYYGPEASWIPFILGRRPKKELTIDLLIRAAEAHRWLD